MTWKAEGASNAQDKRETLLRAAVQLFNEKGFGSTSLDDVAASLGISKPTIYYYLGNKDRVLLECISRGLQQLQQAAADARMRQGMGRDRLESFLIEYAKINMDDFGRCTIRTRDHDLSPESARTFRQLKRSVDAELRALLEGGMADGSIARSDVRLLAFAIAGALNAPAYWFDAKGALDAGTVARALVAILIEGMAPRGTSEGPD